MKKLVLAIVTVMLFVGCNELNGVFDVQKNFILKTTQGDTQVNPGSYKSALNFKKNKIAVAVKGNGGDIKFEIKLNSNVNIPANGNFQISRAESGQSFDIQGSQTTTVTKSGMKNSFEPCSMPYNDVICTPQGCFPQSGTRIGQKRTDYYNETTSRNIQFSLNDDSDVNGFAKFSGQQSEVQKIVVREGMCF